MASRRLKLFCINDKHVVEFLDTGVDRNGDPTSQRQALMRVLEKKVVVGDLKVATFCLAEAPEVLFVDDDEFENRYLRDRSGNWALPTPQWMEMREARSGERARRAAQHGEAAQEALAQKAVGAMIDLARQMGGGSVATAGGGESASKVKTSKGGAA